MSFFSFFSRPHPSVCLPIYLSIYLLIRVYRAEPPKVKSFTFQDRYPFSTSPYIVDLFFIAESIVSALKIRTEHLDKFQLRKFKLKFKLKTNSICNNRGVCVNYSFDLSFVRMRYTKQKQFFFFYFRTK